MPSPVKISDTLLAQGPAGAIATHRSSTAQIEHGATIDGGVEATVAYREVLGSKRAGETPPAAVTREDGIPDRRRPVGRKQVTDGS